MTSSVASAATLDHTAGVADPEPALSVAEAAARVGLTAATLRTWHRRYGLGPSERTAGGHRRYNALDLARLHVVQHMVEGGVPPGEAVAACLELGPEALQDVPRPATGGHPGGGHVLPLPDGDEAQRGLARAAVSLDATAISRIVTELMDEHGVVAAWEQVITPVMVALGDRWYRTKRGIEIEHITSDAVTAALRAYGEPVVSDRRPVLLACVPDELHALPLVALEAALREAGVPVVGLGSRVPMEAVADAVTRLRPRRIVWWAQQSGLADPAIVDSIPRQRPAAGVVLAGPGWAGQSVTDVERPDSLAAAVELLSQ